MFPKEPANNNINSLSRSCIHVSDDLASPSLFNRYSEAGCLFEWRYSEAIKVHNCWPWFLPESDGVGICGGYNHAKFLTTMARLFVNKSSSPCLPDCADVKSAVFYSKSKVRNLNSSSNIYNRHFLSNLRRGKNVLRNLRQLWLFLV